MAEYRDAFGAEQTSGSPTHETPDVSAVLDRPAWQADAACREHPELDWFFERGVLPEAIGAVKAVCATCLVRDDCLDFALDNGERYGVWGGLSVLERRAVRRKRRLAA